MFSVTNGENITLDGGAGNDSLAINGGTAISISSGEGTDTLQFGGEVTATISDFNAADIIKLDSSISAATFADGVLTFSDVTLTLGNVTDIQAYSETQVYNGNTATAATALKNLLQYNFAYNDTTYYFETDTAIAIKTGAVALLEYQLDSAKTYIKTEYNATDKQLTTTTVTNGTSGAAYTFAVADTSAEIDLSYSNEILSVTNGTAIISAAGSIYSSDNTEIIFSGTISQDISVKVASGTATEISKPNDGVKINFGTNTIYQASGENLIKSVNNSNSFTDSTIALSSVTNVLTANYTETNNYSLNAEKTQAILAKGALGIWLTELGIDISAGYELVDGVTYTGGVTFTVSGNAITGVVADNFTEGEKVKVGDAIYTNFKVSETENKIIAENGKAYTESDWSAFITDKDTAAKWEYVDYWKLEDGKLNYYDGAETPAKLFTISGLTLSLTADTPYYYIAGISADLTNSKVTIGEDFIGTAQITVDGASYTFDLSAKAADILLASANNTMRRYNFCRRFNSC